jgi:hypothetical protein
MGTPDCQYFQLPQKGQKTPSIPLTSVKASGINGFFIFGPLTVGEYKTANWTVKHFFPEFFPLSQGFPEATDHIQKI